PGQHAGRRKRQRAPQQVGTEAPPAGAGAIGQRAHQRIGDGIDQLGDQHHRADRGRGQGHHVGVEDQQEGRDVGPVQVEAEVADAVADLLAQRQAHARAAFPGGGPWLAHVPPVTPVDRRLRRCGVVALSRVPGSRSVGKPGYRCHRLAPRGARQPRRDVKPCSACPRHLPCLCPPGPAAMSSRFVHLHLRSEYSLADSTIRIPDLVKRCAELGQPSVAITDRNNLFSLVKFYRAAEGAGIKPVAGADVLVADGTQPAWLLTLLCRDHAGYLSLSRLLTRAWMQGHRHDGVVVRPEWLADDAAGLFALAGRHSRAGQLIAGRQDDLASQALADLQQVYGEDCFLELTRCGLDGEAEFNGFALQASSARGIPVLASNDVRFIDADGLEAHEARVCISSGRVLDDPKRPKDYAPGQYLKASEEMA